MLFVVVDVDVVGVVVVAVVVVVVDAVVVVVVVVDVVVVDVVVVAVVVVLLLTSYFLLPNVFSSSLSRCLPFGPLDTVDKGPSTFSCRPFAETPHFPNMSGSEKSDFVK